MSKEKKSISLKDKIFIEEEMHKLKAFENELREKDEEIKLNELKQEREMLLLKKKETQIEVQERHFEERKKRFDEE